MNTAMGQVEITPLGQFYHIKRLSLLLSIHVFACLRKIHLKYIFVDFFHHFMHLYCPGRDADNPHGENYEHNWRLLLL